MLSVVLLLIHLAAMCGCVALIGTMAGLFLAFIRTLGMLAVDWDGVYSLGVHFAGCLLVLHLSQWFLRA